MDIIEMMQVLALSALFGYVLAAMSGGGSVESSYGRAPRTSDTQKRIKPGHLLLILVVVGSLSFVRDVIVGSTPFGTTVIDSVLEKREYSEEYYVFAFPDDEKITSYRVKARIHSYSKLENMERIRRYEVERIDLPDGVVATFELRKGSGYSLEVDRIITVRDDNGKQWGIQLTRDKFLK